MKYNEFVNEKLRELQAENPDLVFYGQNIDTGSCLGGLTKGIKGLNMPNIENTLCGFGMGLMLGGTSSFYCVKQLDFLFLGMDHLINTWNTLKTMDLKASFTILTIIVDEPKQGPQSSFIRFEDFCRLLDLEPITLNFREDAEELKGKGFRVIGIRSSFMKKETFGRESLIS